VAAELNEIRMQVRTLMLAGRSLADVEEQLIDGADLSDDGKAALWLYAWSFVPEHQQRADALAHLAAIEG